MLPIVVLAFSIISVNAVLNEMEVELEMPEVEVEVPGRRRRAAFNGIESTQLHPFAGVLNNQQAQRMKRRAAVINDLPEQVPLKDIPQGKALSRNKRFLGMDIMDGADNMGGLFGGMGLIGLINDQMDRVRDRVNDQIDRRRERILDNVDIGNGLGIGGIGGFGGLGLGLGLGGGMWGLGGGLGLLGGGLLDN